MPAVSLCILCCIHSLKKHMPSSLSKTLRLCNLPNLPLGIPSSWHQSLQGLLWLCACSLFSGTSLWNVVSLQGVINQGARKEHKADYQKNHSDADSLLIAKNLHHQRSQHLVSFNHCICIWKQCLNHSKRVLYFSGLAAAPVVAAQSRLASSLPFGEPWFSHVCSAVTVISSHCFLGGIAGFSCSETVR